MIKDDIAGMGEARHRSKVRDYLRIRQLQKEVKSVAEIAEALGLKPRRVYGLSKLHISKILSAEQRKGMGCSRELAAIVAGGTISIQTHDGSRRRLTGGG